jgi:hypothetical protein
MEQQDSFEILLSIASDLYKDLRGFRPRHMMAEWRELGYLALGKLVDELAEEIDQSAREEDEYWAWIQQCDEEEARLNFLGDDPGYQRYTGLVRDICKNNLLGYN